MNPGELRHRIDILTLKNVENVYTWEVLDTIWAKAENLDKTNIFSKVGIGVNSAKFTIRKRTLTLHQAVKWQGRHYFLTDINEIDRMYCEVKAAQIEPKTCIATRKIFDRNELNRPVPGDPQTIATFPGYLVEKYLGYQQEKPQAVQELTYVLVTPKVIELKTADLITIGEKTYNVRIPHCLDEYKNEYEITLAKDV
jgi:head-tail adaptor